MDYISRQKDTCRAFLKGVGVKAADYGRLAEFLRQTSEYRQCRQLFVSPSPALKQIRINALADGKELIMPGPGLKKGFYLFKPYSVPFQKLSLAVGYKGLERFGRLLDRSTLSELDIELLLTEALAVDEAGVRLGHGSGFFDLACAILRRYQALAENPFVWAVCQQSRQEPLPEDPWDVRVHGVISNAGARYFQHTPFQADEIFWQSILLKRVKKIDLLWHEYNRLT